MPEETQPQLYRVVVTDEKLAKFLADVAEAYDAGVQQGLGEQLSECVIVRLLMSDLGAAAAVTVRSDNAVSYGTCKSMAVLAGWLARRSS